MRPIWMGTLSGWVSLLAGCISPESLVPPTADQDPSLPSLEVTVAGAARVLHLEEHGDPAAPTVLVMPGGPGADFRLLRPLAELADAYHVVLWDPRGAGLSERVPTDELGLDTFVDEIDAVRQAMAPDEPVVLMGHSFGAGQILRYAAAHPDAVAGLVLLDPGPLTPEAAQDYRGGGISFLDGQEFFWMNEVLASSDHAAADLKALEVVPVASRSFTCGRVVPEVSMWRFGAWHHERLAHFESPGTRWADGVELDRILVVIGTCGEPSRVFREHDQLAELPAGAEVVTLDGADHYSLFTDHADPLLAELRGFLAPEPRP